MIGVLSWPRMPNLASLLRRSAVVLILFQTLLVFYSPQFILWLMPFLLPLSGRHRRLIWLVVSLDLATWVIWIPSDMPFDLLCAIMGARHLLMVLLLVVLFRWDVAARRSGEPIYTPALAPQQA